MSANIRPDNHICCIYKTDAEHQAIVTSFIRQGLKRGEKVIYAYYRRTPETITAYFKTSGFNVSPYITHKQFILCHSDTIFHQDGYFDPETVIQRLQTETEKALTQGYAALRFTSEMSWVLRGLPHLKQLVEFEAKVNERLIGHRCLIFCQYDHRRFTSDFLLDMLHTHPTVVVDKEMYENCYYMPPEELLAPYAESAQLRHCLEDLAERKYLIELAQQGSEALLSRIPAQHPHLDIEQLETGEIKIGDLQFEDYTYITASD